MPTRSPVPARYALLDRVDAPADLRRVDVHELPALADELRHCLIDTVSRTGGHLAAGLGVVELTVALHYVFDTPEDRLVWDVGHQAYPHKILTGRRGRMATLRQKGGLSVFTNRWEPPYDAYLMGHAGTAGSAALGIAMGDRLLGNDRRSVAVVGDAAMGCGVAFEALNHAGSLDHQERLLRGAAAGGSAEAEACGSGRGRGGGHRRRGREGICGEEPQGQTR